MRLSNCLKIGESKGSAPGTVSHKNLYALRGASEDFNASLLDVSVFGEVDMGATVMVGDGNGAEDTRMKEISLMHPLMAMEMKTLVQRLWYHCLATLLSRTVTSQNSQRLL